jgi:hypothetical protein
MAFVDALRALNAMASRSDEFDVGRPSPELLARLRQGKAPLHQHHASLPLQEKVRLVIELQRIVLSLIARQRALRSWERPWDIEP